MQWSPWHYESGCIDVRIEYLQSVLFKPAFAVAVDSTTASCLKWKSCNSDICVPDVPTVKWEALIF